MHLLSTLTPAAELVMFALKVKKTKQQMTVMLLHSLSNTINDVSAVTIARFKTLVSPTFDAGVWQGAKQVHLDSDSEWRGQHTLLMTCGCGLRLAPPL